MAHKQGVMKATTKLRFLIWGYVPGCIYMQVANFLRAWREGFELGWLIAVLFGNGPMAISTYNLAYMLYAQPPFYRRWRHELMLVHIIGVVIPGFVVMHFRPLSALHRSYVFEGAFGVLMTLIGELPLRYTLLVALVSMPVNYCMMLDAAGGSWPTYEEYWRNAMAVVGMMLVAPVLLHVAWMPREPPPQRGQSSNMLVQVLQACERALVVAEQAITSRLGGLSPYHLVAGACYPVLALHVYKNVMAGLSGISNASPPFEVLTGLVCCGVLATTQQGIFGIKLLARLKTAQALLSDIFPEHITNALGVMMSPPSSAGGVLPPPGVPDINPRKPVRRRSSSLGLGAAGVPRARRITQTMHSVLHTIMSTVGKLDGIGGGGNNQVLAKRHEAVTILFADITGFTTLCDEELEPVEVMAMLHLLYTSYDKETAALKVYKVETIGDCYMAATGLLSEDPQQAEHMLRFAFKMLTTASQVRKPNGEQLHIRIGMHTGSITSGLVGLIRRRYCLFGDTVNTASRMESTACPDCIQVSDATHRLVEHMPGIKWRSQLTAIKGKSVMLTHIVDHWDRELYG